MPILSNPHTHTNHVDGKNTALEMTERALELGFTSLGFSEHAKQYIDPAYSLSEAGERNYIEDVKRAREFARGRMRVFLGIERDRVSSADRALYEYVIAANHYFVLSDGSFCSVDGDVNALVPIVNALFGGDWTRAAAKYFADYAEYVADYKPDIIAHFDLIVKNNRKMRWFDEADDAYLRLGYDALERMRSGCDVMEVNTGGMARSGQPCPYPIPPFLARWRELGGRVIVSSDCHRAHQLDARFDCALGYLARAGYKSRLVLGAGDELFEEVAL